MASTASTSAGTLTACPSLINVIGFNGIVTVKVGDAASGQSGRTSGTQTIQLGRVMHQVHFHLANKRHERSIFIFSGTGTGGTVQVDDSLEDTGSSLGGELKYAQPANESEEAYLFIDFSACAYNFAALANVSGAYEGDDEFYKNTLGPVRRNEWTQGRTAEPDPARRQIGHRHVPGSLRMARRNRPSSYRAARTLEAAGPPN